MTPRLGPRLLAAALPLALLLPAAAHAEKVVTQDAVGDVVTIDDDDLEQTTPAPDHAGADVVRTVVAHGDHRVAITVHFRGLGREPIHFTFVRVRTPTGTYDLLVERWGGTPVTNLTRGEDAVDCRALKGKADRRTDTVAVTLPAACLGSPRWVQVGVGAISVDADQLDQEVAAGSVDDAHRAGEVRDDLAWGPRVRRG